MRQLVLSLADVAVWASRSRIPNNRAGFLDLETGMVHAVSLFALSCVERDSDPSELDDRDYDHLPLARSTLANPNRYVEIPKLPHGLEEEQELLLREVRKWLHSLGVDPVDKYSPGTTGQ